MRKHCRRLCSCAGPRIIALSPLPTFRWFNPPRNAAALEHVSRRWCHTSAPRPDDPHVSLEDAELRVRHFLGNHHRNSSSGERRHQRRVATQQTDAPQETHASGMVSRTSLRSAGAFPQWMDGSSDAYLRGALDALIASTGQLPVLQRVWFDACRAAFLAGMYTRVVELFLAAHAQLPHQVFLTDFVVDAAAASRDPALLLHCLEIATSACSGVLRTHHDEASGKNSGERPAVDDEEGGNTLGRYVSAFRGIQSSVEPAPTTREPSHRSGTAPPIASEEFVLAAAMVWRIFWRCAVQFNEVHRSEIFRVDSESQKYVPTHQNSSSSSGGGDLLAEGRNRSMAPSSFHSPPTAARSPTADGYVSTARLAFSYLFPSSDFVKWWDRVRRLSIYSPLDSGEATAFFEYFSTAIRLLASPPSFKQTQDPTWKDQKEETHPGLVRAEHYGERDLKIALRLPALATMMMRTTRRGERLDYLDTYFSWFTAGFAVKNGALVPDEEHSSSLSTPNGAASPLHDAVVTAYTQCLLESHQLQKIAAVIAVIRSQRTEYIPNPSVLSVVAKAASEMRDDDLAVWCIEALLHEAQQTPPTSADIFRCLVALAKCHNSYFTQVLESVRENGLLIATKDDVLFLQLLYLRHNTISGDPQLCRIVDDLQRGKLMGISERNAGILLRILGDLCSSVFPEVYAQLRKTFPNGSEKANWCGVAVEWAMALHGNHSWEAATREILRDVETVREELSATTGGPEAARSGRAAYRFSDSIEASCRLLNNSRVSGTIPQLHEKDPPRSHMQLTLGVKAGDQWIRTSENTLKLSSTDPSLRFAKHGRNINVASDAALRRHAFIRRTTHSAAWLTDGTHRRKPHLSTMEMLAFEVRAMQERTSN